MATPNTEMVKVSYEGKCKDFIVLFEGVEYKVPSKTFNKSAKLTSVPKSLQIKYSQQLTLEKEGK